MLNCDEVKNIISDYIDEQVDTDTRNLIEEHISTCKACNMYLNEMKAVIDKCAQIDEEELPETFRQSLHDKLVKEVDINKADASKATLRRKYIGIFSTVAAGLALVIILKGVYTNFYKNSDYGYSTETSSKQATSTDDRSKKSMESSGNSTIKDSTSTIKLPGLANITPNTDNTADNNADKPNASPAPDGNSNINDSINQNQDDGKATQAGGNIVNQSPSPQSSQSAVESNTDAQYDAQIEAYASNDVNAIKSAGVPSLTATYNDPEKQKARVFDAEVTLYASNTQDMTAKVQGLMEQYSGMFDSEDKIGNQSIVNDNNKVIMNMLIPCGEDFENFWSNIKSTVGESNYSDEKRSGVPKELDNTEDMRVRLNMMLENSQTDDDIIAVEGLKRLDLLDSYTCVTVTITQR